ncbi:uncharacterized protein BT62DRAFT_972254 [Guyanagaster necrorhizus]|uniref:VLRF1 domain-containing protein n=1 Tax=Guyanagaster necrorhizus TaxID=856835 RepID=A0A9P8APS7_9AGAR|nr:uncharacterized protein BT62DRAFT_972254 [Guyanagaster necrorhizus MCA 3950]KAG7443658.1 hypothetical protein BT62DRAFT_972254 [Guyanagaster necrorhizus MCA 3950]
MQKFYVFSLPTELLDTLTPRNLVNQQPQRRTPSFTPPAEPTLTSSRACNICNGSTFLDVAEQRSHYRSDWHRYNVKIRLGGGSAVNESEFAQLIDALDDSISGSESSSDENDSEDSDAVAALVGKTKRVIRSQSPESVARSTPQTALAWFHSPPATQIGVYRTLFPPTSHYLEELKTMQSSVQGRTWTLFMVAGGHFAGAVVRVSRSDADKKEKAEAFQGKKKPKHPKPEIEVLKHKTFHRYTTRRKQGGSQSLNDNAKGNAKSAGALLRRYGEQALRDDIRNLMDDWREEINDCERIWIRASGSNRKIFMDYDGSIISKGDARLRTFPFPTRRPTQAELIRCLNELTVAKVSHLTEEALCAQDEEYLASLPKPKPTPAVAAPKEPSEKVKAPQLSKEEESFRDKWFRIAEMIRKGRLEPLKAFWEREGTGMGGIDASIPEWANERWSTLLQLAVHAEQEDIVHWLLEDMRADPTIQVPAGKNGEIPEDVESTGRITGRTAYDLAQTRTIRDVFRRSAGLHPERWDWFGAARVPSALSKEMEDDREEKKKSRRKALKDRVKERETREKDKQVEPPFVASDVPLAPSVRADVPSGPRKLGGTAGSSEATTGLNSEMRTIVERERRARAAEARLKAFSK